MSLKHTRAIIDGIHDKSLDMSEFQTMKRFGLKIPLKVRGVPSELLRPIEGWKDKDSYKKASLDLAVSFHHNFKRYAAGVPPEIVRNGGPNLDL